MGEYGKSRWEVKWVRFLFQFSFAANSKNKIQKLFLSPRGLPRGINNNQRRTKTKRSPNDSHPRVPGFSIVIYTKWRRRAKTGGSDPFCTCTYDMTHTTTMGEKDDEMSYCCLREWNQKTKGLDEVYIRTNQQDQDHEYEYENE
jgi:hypothetical protein